MLYVLVTLHFYCLKKVWLDLRDNAIASKNWRKTLIWTSETAGMVHNGWNCRLRIPDNFFLKSL